MITYKNMEMLEKRAKDNTGDKVKIWDDYGIKVNGKVYRMLEYGNMGYNFTGNSYCTFYNKTTDDYITIEYELLHNDKEHTNNIFNFLLLRNNY
jgi:Icc-related predicted phosphoesterase